MGKHENGYGRIERDYYPTPAWVIEALTEHIDIKGLHILEPACGDGRMAEALKAAGAQVYATDIEDRGYEHLNGLVDFTLSTQLEFQFDARFNGAVDDFDAVVTNPPLGHRGRLGVSFIEIGLVQMNSASWRCCCRRISIRRRPVEACSVLVPSSRARSS
jgi:SAM-dependent methyltransferase